MYELFSKDQQLEFIQAEVLAIDYAGYYRRNGYYMISCRPVGSKTDNEIVNAIPLDYNIKRLPIVGEIVLLVAALSAFSTARSSGKTLYYLNSVPVHKSYNHNALPTVTNKGALYSKQQDSYQDSLTTGRVKIQKTEAPLIDRNFEEKSELNPLQMFSGDMIVEGRFGNSLRFGSTIKSDHPFGAAPAWSQGRSQVGDPITILSNGRKKSLGNNRLTIESINEDDSSIWLTSGQQLFFAPASAITNVLRNNKFDSFIKSNFSGNQILLSSDRINLNAKKYEVNIFSKTAINLAAEVGISVESDKVIEVESGRINLGINATHPALLGDVTFDLLTKLCDTLMELCDKLTQETHPTGVGPSGPPINASAYVQTKQSINQIKSELPKIKSNLVFLNKSKFASDEADKESKEKFKENLRS
jgi:hypothetical protein